MTTLFISHSSKDKCWAEEIHAVLRQKCYRSLFLDFHPEDGISAGADWEKTLYHRLRQSRAVVVLCTLNWLDSPWCVAEAMIARERGRKLFMLATADAVDGCQVKAPDGSERLLRIPDFLKDTQFIPLANLPMEKAYERLWRGLKEQLRPQDRFPLPKSERPYPGLEPFQEDDAAVFFGRDDEIQRIESALTRRRRGNAEGFMLVLGASGCGKSSLVRAGVVPRLKRQVGEDGSSGRWVIPPPILSGRGLEGLVSSLRQAFEEAAQPMERDVLHRRLEPARDMGRGAERAAQNLHAIASELLDARRLPGAYLVLVLDQLEEVFSTAEPSDARAALRLLLEASAAEIQNPLVVLATMRSDFMNALQSFPGATARYKEIPLDPVPRAHFGEVIEGPAERFGLRLEPGLTERLVEDTRYDDALPLLAFTLKELYKRGYVDGAVTLKQYEALFPEVSVREPNGTRTTYRGVSAAIKLVADEILDDTGYAGLAADDPRMRDLRRAFHSLARVRDQGQFARRVARRSQIPKSCEVVLKEFESRRLLVSGTEDGEPTLSVAHEALFRVWDTLRDWLLQDRKALMLRAQIEDAAAEWDQEQRAENRAWPDDRILDAVREIDNSGVSLGDVTHPEIICAFLGPTSPEELEKLPALTDSEDATAGSGQYGHAWRLPLSHEARASLGVRLALLGDRRRGVGLRGDGLPDIEWCEIEGGEVTIEIRSNPNDPNSEVIETLTRSVEPFRMARYLVTIAQFRVFVAECHRNGQWRLPRGFPVDLRAYHPPPRHRARYGNHPTDSVNWYDAAAFCHWLSARLHAEIRLPTEFEWQLAATGGDPSRTYPWGHEWVPDQEPWRANTFESGLVRSTAVGLYPQGSTKAGILDMAGLLYEWCLNAFNEPDDASFPFKPASLRVRRGGSWLNNRIFARCAQRHWLDPSLRYVNMGFRVCSSPKARSSHRRRARCERTSLRK